MNYRDFYIWFKNKDKKQKKENPPKVVNKSFVLKHLLRCGTCAYKYKGKCHNSSEKTCGEIVDDDCSCDSYMPDRRIKRYL